MAAIDPASGVWIWNVCPKVTDEGAAAIVGRTPLNKYGGEKISRSGG